eukprot:PhF_6_TR36394/c0_g1_i1/m.53490
METADSAIENIAIAAVPAVFLFFVVVLLFLIFCLLSLPALPWPARWRQASCLRRRAPASAAWAAAVCSCESSAWLFPSRRPPARGRHARCARWRLQSLL